MRRTKSWSMAVMLAVALATGLPMPATASAGEADLAVSVASGTVVAGQTKTSVITVVNRGQVAAHDVVLTVDATGLGDNITANPHPNYCDPAVGGVWKCRISRVLPGETTNRWASLVLHGITPAPAGQLTASVTSSTIDGNPADNSTTTRLSVVADGQADLLVRTFDIGTSERPVPPGGNEPLFFYVHNYGSMEVRGLLLTFRLPKGARFMTESNPRCHAPAHGRVALCELPAVTLPADPDIFYRPDLTFGIEVTDSADPGALFGATLEVAALDEAREADRKDNRSHFSIVVGG